MTLLEGMFDDGTIALIAAAFLIIETFVLLALVKHRMVIFPLLWNTLAGIGLLGALYAALSGASWIYCATFLALGLFGHLGETALRLRSAREKG